MKYFKFTEYSRSDTARAHNIDNTPSTYQYQKFEYLVDTILDDLREYTNQSITISSGYRCTALNKLVGGVWNSQHLAEGDSIAVDLVCEDMQLAFEWLRDNVYFDQLLFESNNRTQWIHISLNVMGDNRNQVNNNYRVK